MIAFPLRLSSTCLLIGTGAGGMFSELEAASVNIDMAVRRVEAGRCLTVLASCTDINEVTMGIR